MVFRAKDHGAWLQTNIDRPFIVKVGGTFTPVHFVGFLGEGNIPLGSLGLSYNFGVANSRGEVISRPGDAGDINNNRAWVAKIFARPTRFYGLELGASVYPDKITLLAPNDQGFREWVASAYLVWTKGRRNSYQNLTMSIIAIFSQLRLPTVTRFTSNWVPAPLVRTVLEPYYRFEYGPTP
jgi:hypothetical protein